MHFPKHFSVFPSSQVGDVYATDFVFTSNLPSEFNSLTWEYGDGNCSYNNFAASHAYKYPGEYQVSLSAWKEDGTLVTDSTKIKVDYVYRDAILFNQIPNSFSFPGVPTPSPFTVSVTSANISDKISLVLYPLNTKSIPYKEVEDRKWKFIIPRWRFVDLNYNVLPETIEIDTVPIYKGTKQVAVSGSLPFYYIDDFYTDPDISNETPLVIVASLSTENFQHPLEALKYPYYSFSNNKTVKTAILWQINLGYPAKLKVTENYINDIYSLKWTNVPIPVMVTYETIPNETFGITSLTSADLLSYPLTNEQGEESELILNLFDSSMRQISSEYYKIEKTPLYFKATDDLSNPCGGYVFTSLTPLTAINDSVTLVATTSSKQVVLSEEEFIFPRNLPIYTNAYIANPNKGNINRIDVTTYRTDLDLSHLVDSGIFMQGIEHTKGFTDTPLLTSYNVINYLLSGTSSVYGMAFNPLKNRLYAADADQNSIMSFNRGVEPLTSINLEDIFNHTVLSPSCLSIDQYGNVWASIYDDQKIVKFDSDLNYILSATPTNAIASSKSDTGVGGGVGDTFISPPIVETDKDNNVWVCYSHNLSSSLIKFDSNGNELVTATSLSLTSAPVSLAIDAKNNVWVACYFGNRLEYYSTSGNLLSSFNTEILRPSYIAVDRSNNVWFTHGHDFFSMLDTVTGQTTTWKMGCCRNFDEHPLQYSEEDVHLAMQENEIWGGLSIDVFDRVWLIDSVHNIAHVFNTKSPYNTHKCVKILPQPDTNSIIKTNEEFVRNIPGSPGIRSAQAAGDWTGNRWYQKYAPFFYNTSLSGVSAPFKICDLNSSVTATKINEEFSFAEHYKSLALSEYFKSNEDIFDKFFAAVAGDNDPTDESAGRVIYERIANFIHNHADVETAEIEQLINIARQLNVDAETFGTDFPVAIKRLLNLFSVPKYRLRGIPRLNNTVEDNLGPLLQPNSIINAGEYLAFKPKRFSTDFQLIYVNQSETGATSYPLSSLQLTILQTSPGARITDDYYFFPYNSNNVIGYTNNLINWESGYTSIPYSLSSNEEWYGDDGIIETAFNNLLTRHLFAD